MDNIETPSSQMVSEETVPKTQKTTLFSDLKALIKVGIINSNLITAFAGFWLALYFTNSSLFAYWDIFLLTMAGVALVIAGGCILNNWYDADIDLVMSRTKRRPTVTGKVSLHTVMGLGIGTTALGLLLLLFTTVEATMLALFGWFVYVVLYTMW